MFPLEGEFAGVVLGLQSASEWRWRVDREPGTICMQMSELRKYQQLRSLLAPLLYFFSS